MVCINAYLYVLTCFVGKEMSFNIFGVLPGSDIEAFTIVAGGAGHTKKSQ
jgi:hypothetical protein